MLQERVPDLSRRLSEFVEPYRVRREVYTDPAIFELEMQRIHERVWVYCGHESQVPKPGDYYAVQIGRQPMVMVRGADGKVNVLYNRCPHRGNMMVGDRHGSSGEFFRCSYHAWTFHHDGRLRSIPMMESGYAGTRYGKDNPDCSMKHAARVENYRGFVFASLSPEGPSLVADHGFTTGQIGLTSFEKLLSPTTMKVGVEHGLGCFADKLPEDERTKTVVPDQFRHEIATSFNLKGRGLVVLTSCSHRGVVNAIKQAQAVSGIDKVHAVIGGFHLAPYKEDYVRQTMDSLQAINLDYVVPLHCSGEPFYEMAKAEMPSKLLRSYTGTRFVFSA